MKRKSKQMADEQDDDTTNAEVEVLDPVEFKPSEALQQAIKDGNVTTKVREVSVSQKDPAGNVIKVFRQSYTQCTAKNEIGALALPGIDGDEEKIWDFVSTRADNNVFQNVYVRLRNMAAGPEKALAKIEKLLKDLPDSAKALALEKFKEAGLI